MINTDVIFIILFGSIIWLLVLSFFVFRVKSHYNRLTKGSSDNLQGILDNILTETKTNKKELLKVKEHLEKIEKENLFHIQKVGLLRFNPFENTGGDQSFVLAILNGKDTGIILTSLHSRGATRWYAKNVKEGKGTDHELGKEELSAIKNALNLKS